MSETVKKFYDSYGVNEVERLSSVYCTFEYQNNLKLMKKYLPPSGRVLEIGAGPGQYSLPLLKQGYRVTLFDISEVQLKIADDEFKRENVTPDALICDDARNLGTLADHDFDAILLMGPMYHIIDGSERAAVLKNVKDKLKTGGIALVEFINAWGVLRVGLDEFPKEYEDVNCLTRYLAPFSIDTAEEAVNDFTDVYLSTPPAASEVLLKAGFEIISYAGTESFVSGMKPSIEMIHEKYPDAFRNIVDVAFSASERHPFRDLTEHLTFVVRKK